MAHHLIKNWHDATEIKSYIKKLHFEPTHKWSDVEIIINGTRRKTRYNIDVLINGEKSDDRHFCGSIKDDETKILILSGIPDYAVIDITGYISRANLFFGAGADITVRTYYTDTIEQSA